MNIFKQLLLGAFLCTGLCACPYKSKYPISEPVGPPGKILTGTWYSGNDKVSVTAGTDNKMYIVLDKGYSTSGYVAWIVPVDSTWSFMNIRPIDQPNDTNYYIYRVDSLTDTRCRLSGLARQAYEPAMDSEDLQRGLEMLGDLKSAFPAEEVMTFSRKR
jgi:hypothetical protein